MWSIAQTVLDDKTLVSLGTALAILTPLALGFAWLNKKLTKIESDLEAIKTGRRETWTYSQMDRWSVSLKRLNPQLRVPGLVQRRDGEEDEDDS